MEPRTVIRWHVGRTMKEAMENTPQRSEWHARELVEHYRNHYQFRYRIYRVTKHIELITEKQPGAGGEATNG